MDVDPVAWYARGGKRSLLISPNTQVHDLLNLHLHRLIPTLPFKLAHDDRCCQSRIMRKTNNVAYTEYSSYGAEKI